MPREGSSRRGDRRLRACALAGVCFVLGAGAGGCGGDSSAPPTTSSASANAQALETRPGAAPPNVVVVMTDDQDVASMELMPIVQRELVERGVEFTNSYVGLSECCPSRATFLTGQHAHNHGVEVSKPPDGGYAKLDGTNTLAVWLDDAGYRTGQVGRYLNFYGNSNVGTDPLEVPPGWDDWHVPVEHTEFQHYDYVLNENGRLHEYGGEPSDYGTDVFAGKAVDFIERAADAKDPFFLWVTPLAPHTEGVLEDQVDAPRNPRPAPRDQGAFDGVPVPQPPSFGEIDESDKPDVVREVASLAAGAPPDAQLKASFRGRLESLLAVDRMVGKIMDALRQTGELDRTYVVFTSDNGYLLGEHRLTGKHAVYEESIRVPLVVRGPGIPAGVQRPGLVQNIDLAPTIVDVADAAAGREMDGISLLPAADTGSVDEERNLLIEYPRTKLAYAAVRSPDDLVYVAYDDGSTELYDLKEDPYQLENVAGAEEYAAVQERLAERLESLRDCAGADCR
jgi:N-acetylglucosamine-6-sulfatase